MASQSFVAFLPIYKTLLVKLLLQELRYIICCFSASGQKNEEDIILYEFINQVVKKMWVYIREKDLQDPKNRKKIICDEKLKKLFNVNAIDMFQMNKALTKHIWPLEDGIYFNFHIVFVKTCHFVKVTIVPPFPCSVNDQSRRGFGIF